MVGGADAEIMKDFRSDLAQRMGYMATGQSGGSFCNSKKQILFLHK
jgi:uncharacterized phage protein gp47/JayE